jgi:hypothetical protein
MAVTAPTYVLEESLSSQKLWKDTAGNRPPQPVEERAFYEKMWAQNFAKSQVAYGMPVEVLTATSPISLSPFADGNFRTELSNYDIKEDSKQPADLAEAALVDRLQGHHKEFGVKAMEPQHPQLTVVNKRVKGSGKLRTVLPYSWRNENYVFTISVSSESDPSLTVLVRGDNVFGTTVSKSFARASETGGPVEGVDTVNISIASYRVVEVSICLNNVFFGILRIFSFCDFTFSDIQSKKHGKYAQYLVIYREGSIRDTVGVWKRYSDFADLSRKVTHQHESCASVLQNMSPLAVTEEPETEHLPNAITSWRLLKKRQRWYRCLDAGYLSLKVFLLERFLHDILFESSSPRLLRGFVGSEEVSSDSSAASK